MRSRPSPFVSLLLVTFAGCSSSPEMGPRDGGLRDLSRPDQIVNPVPLRFVVLGDGGEGNQGQYDVASAMHTVCEERGCEFALYLGDNFYNDGVDSVDDEQFQTKFELPYAEIAFPFYAALGNHDYGGQGIGLIVEWEKAAYEVEYTTDSAKWRMPAEYYDFVVSNVHFVALDTTAIMHEQGFEPQNTWIGGVLDDSTSPWRIAYGHHPYVSNGAHGNVGEYDGLSPTILPRLAGVYLKEFFDDNVCGEFDVYFSGHDHNRQWLGATCGTLFVVSGSGCKISDLDTPDRNTVLYEDDSEPGFLWVEIEGDVMRAAFYDAQANLDFSTEITRPSVGLR